MKNFVCLILTFTFFLSIQIYSQERDSLIQLYPGIGNTINLFNKEYFNLFENVNGFQTASLYIRNQNKLISRLTLDISGELVDTIFVQPVSILKKVQTEIDKIARENNKRIEIKANSIFTLKNKRSIKGKLDMFSQKDVYLVSNEKVIKESHNARFKIPVSKVEKINILGESKTWSYAGWGALIGLAVGGIIYFSAKDDVETNPNMVGGFQGLELLTGPILGGLVGLIIGSASSTDDEIYKIDSKYDLLKLKNYAKYYFQYDKSLEETYEQLE